MITMRFVQRIAAVSCGLALALGGVVAVAPVADASPQRCFYYVLENVPDANPETVEAACKAGAPGGENAFLACYKLLRKDYVPAVIAANGCRRAAAE
uniref:Dihydroorotate dehydrogenase n=1 Tax=Streptomyces citricolor TaxID=212427 RepID=A0A7R6FI25_9ACTN|nr:dihydroorotate dehydrogenase [Streptomyces citricolor]